MLAHDIVLAEERTVFALGYSRIGTSPDGGNSYFLTRDLGYRRALELYLLNERIDAGRAHELGLVNRVTPAADSTSPPRSSRARLAAGPWRAHAAAKRLLRRAGDGVARPPAGG